MQITKSFVAKQEIGQPSPSDLETINKLFALEALAPEDIFVVKMHLANDQIDRSFERFPVPVLERFADTIIGKHLLTGHDKTNVPAGTFFDADVVRQSDGSHHLVTRAYLDANDALVGKIRKGIAKDVSIGAAVDQLTCDLCGKSYHAQPGDKEPCRHQLSQQYDGDTCTATYGGDLTKYEAHEGSLVYLGCQRGAQVVSQAAHSRIVKSILPYGSEIISGGPPAPPEEEPMEMKEALAEIERLEGEKKKLAAQLDEQAAMLKFAEDAREALLGEVQRKYTAIKAERTGQTIVKGLKGATMDEIREADKEVQAMFDEKFPPSGNGRLMTDAERSGGAEKQIAARPGYGGL